MCFYRGRFAPTPSGHLHMGSILAAVASYLDAKARKGTWLVRIEDTDLPRCKRRYTDSILKTLEGFALYSDEDIIFQSARGPIYEEYLQYLLSKQKAYFCTCSRSQLASLPKGIDGAPIYDGKCKNKKISSTHASVRLALEEEIVEFEDAVFGKYSQNVQEDVGDYVIKRADGIFAYHFACIIDDFLQDITHVVRGYDLLNSTPRQILLQKSLDFLQPDYLHIPLLIKDNGEKLSKYTKDTPVQIKDASKILFACLEILGQNPPAELVHETSKTILEWGKKFWKREAIPKVTEIKF